jgi:hypothetical protein
MYKIEELFPAPLMIIDSVCADKLTQFEFIIKDIMKEKKIDGLKYLNKWEGYGHEFSYSVFYPEQIKLADGTNTTFDANNPDIRYKDGGIINDFKYTIGGL